VKTGYILKSGNMYSIEVHIFSKFVLIEFPSLYRYRPTTIHAVVPCLEIAA